MSDKNLLLVLWAVEQRLEHNIGLEIVQDLVVTEVAVFGQVQNWSLLFNLIVLIVVHFDQSLSNEVHLFHITLVANDTLAWS